MISVVIPTCPGNEEMLKRCLTSLFATSPKDFNFVVVKNHWRGFAVAVNKGLKSALGDPEVTGVLLLNDDAIMLPGWVEEVETALKQEGVGIVADPMSWREDHACMWCALIKREVFENIGVIDEQFRIGECEDLDFGYRATRAGFKIVKTANRIAAHEVSQTIHRHPDFEVERLRNREK